MADMSLAGVAASHQRPGRRLSRTAGLARVAIRLALAAAAAAGWAGAAAAGTPLWPAEAHQYNQELEQRTDRYSFEWRLKARFDAPGRSPDARAIAAARKRAVADAAKQLARSKITDPRQRSEFLAARARQGVERIVPEHDRWESVWQFERNGSATAASGGYQGGGFLLTFRYYFDGPLGVVVNDTATHSRYPGAVPLPASIWECSGPSIRRRPTGEQGLALGPEDFALLSGLDLLRIYDAAWTLQKVTAAEVVLGATTKATPRTNQQLTLVLDASAEGAPSEIIVQRRGWSARLRVLQRREFAGTRIPSVVERVVRWPDGTVQRLEWTLSRISEAGAIRLAIPRNHLVTDTRLLGRDLSVGQVLDAQELRDPRIVLYKWPGTLPPRDELPRIRDRELARRGVLICHNSPAPLLWLSGAGLAAVGIVWRRRTRRRRQDAADDSPGIMR